MDKVKTVKIQGFEGVDNKHIWVKVLMEDGRKIMIEANAYDTLEDIIDRIVRKIKMSIDFWTFILMVASLFVGTIVGVFITCLCVIAKRGGQD